MKQRTVAVIQARMGSSRLPGKTLRKILGKPMLWHIINRIKHSSYIDEIIVATSLDQKDNEIEKFCIKNKIHIFRGSEEDVLERFYFAAKQEQADIVLRITGDCPFIDPEIINRAIEMYHKGNYDYVAVMTGAGASNKAILRFPDGMDCEVFSFSSLEKAFQEATSDLEREHATMYIWKQPEKFRLGELTADKDYYSFLRFTVDYNNDLTFVRNIYKHLYPKNNVFHLADILLYLQLNPKVMNINQSNIGREGYNLLWEKDNAK